MIIYFNDILYLECYSDSECKGLNEKCDLHDHMCKQQCINDSECTADKMYCDTLKGVCIHGKIQLLFKTYIPLL